MNEESHIAYLKSEIEKKEELIADKQKQIDLLESGIKIEKDLLKVLQKGLEKMKEQEK